MKAIERYLYLRKNYYYFRKALPRSLWGCLKERDIWIGLDTQDLNYARAQVAQLNYEITPIIQKLQSDLRGLGEEDCIEKTVNVFHEDLTAIKHQYGYANPVSKRLLLSNAMNSTVSFLSMVELYLQDCPMDAHSTRMHKVSTYSLFSDVIGDRPLNKIGVKEARLFKSRLLLMPANAKRVWGVESFKAIDWSKVKATSVQNPRTINNRISYLGVFFNWAIKSGYYHSDNPFSGIKIRKSQQTYSSRVHPFEITELQSLLKSDAYRNSRHPSMRWVPLVGLYSGMRLNEICQLYGADIQKKESVYVFNVNDNGNDKKLKTPSSQRVVPIHHTLIEMGFLDYVRQVECGGYKRLFPDIPMGASSQNYSSTFTKRFWRLLKVTKIKRSGLCFHSMRHTFIDGMRNAGVESSVIMTLVGHQSNNRVHNSYGYGYNISALKEYIDKLSFDLD